MDRTGIDFADFEADETERMVYANCSPKGGSMTHNPIPLWR